MRYIALRLAFMGTNYHGWQKQKGLETVSGMLERAIKAVTGDEEIRLTGCGRTDAGVHAETYVANFSTESRIPCDRLPYAINARLNIANPRGGVNPRGGANPRGGDIAVYEAWEVDEDFHAVFSGIRKQYTYVIYEGRVLPPMYHGRAWFYQRPSGLDTDKMRQAAGHFIGEHDFVAFRSVGSNVKTTVRTMYSAEVLRNENFVRIVMTASGFLYNMARTLAGTLVYVSEGKLAPDDIPEIIKSGDRNRAGPNLPPQGLYMTGVSYPE